MRSTTTRRSSNLAMINTRAPPRPTPSMVNYSDEDSAKGYDENPDDSDSLTEKPSEISSTDSQVWFFCGKYLYVTTPYSSSLKQDLQQSSLFTETLMLCFLNSSFCTSGLRPFCSFCKGPESNFFLNYRKNTINIRKVWKCVGLINQYSMFLYQLPKALLKLGRFKECFVNCTIFESFNKTNSTVFSLQSTKKHKKGFTRQSSLNLVLSFLVFFQSSNVFVLFLQDTGSEQDSRESSDPHSFVNHYANVNNTFRQSWKRQKPIHAAGTSTAASTLLSPAKTSQSKAGQSTSESNGGAIPRTTDRNGGITNPAARGYSSFTESSDQDGNSAVVSLNGTQLVMNNKARSRAPLPGFSSFV